MSSIVEWGQEPEEGMIAIGFSADAVIEGKDLKNRIINSLRKKNIGIRESTKILMQEAYAPFDEALRLSKEIKKDLKEKKDSFVINKKYKYYIDRVFWGFEKDIPKNDPRYFKLNIIDLSKINLERYENADKSFDAHKFIREHMTEEDRNKFIKKLESKIIDPEEELDDKEWET